VLESETRTAAAPEQAAAGVTASEALVLDAAPAESLDEVVAFADAEPKDEAGSGDTASGSVDRAGAAVSDADVATVAPDEAPQSAVAQLAAPSRVADSLLGDSRTEGTAALTADAGTDSNDDTTRRAERRRADSPVAVTSAIEQTSLGNRQEPVEEDERTGDDEPLLTVPGFEVLSVTSLGEGTSPVGVHYIQRLENGDLLEIFHLQPEIEPATLTPLEEGMNEVRVLTEGGWIVMRGPRPTAELQELLASLFPEG